MNTMWLVWLEISGEQGTGAFVAFFVIVILFILGFLIFAVIRTQKEIARKAEEGLESYTRLLQNGEFKSEKTAISYTATIHRLYHIAAVRGRPINSGIRASCSFCEELAQLATEHFMK